jgi:hypothetical protein
LVVFVFVSWVSPKVFYVFLFSYIKMCFVDHQVVLRCLIKRFHVFAVFCLSINKVYIISFQIHENDLYLCLVCR